MSKPSMNDLLRAAWRGRLDRRIHFRQDAPPQEPAQQAVDEAAVIPPGNAGNGTGSPPAPVETGNQRMNAFIRSHGGKKYNG